MKIHEFEAEERLSDIRKNYIQVKEIKDSLSEYRDKYRILSRDVNIEQESLLQCCDFFERTLLINCFTFSEQLVKNFVYEILEKDRHQNTFLNRFIDNKIPKDKFSPNVSYSSIKKLLSNELCSGYEFSLKDGKNCFRIYDDMVKSRHTYAHSGIYNFDFNNFEIVIQVLEFLYSELKMLLENNMDYRKEYQKLFLDIENSTSRICNIFNSGNKENFRAYGKNLNNLKSDCSKFISKYYESLRNVKLFNPILDKVSDISKLDLRSKEKFIEAAVELKNLIL